MTITCTVNHTGITVRDLDRSIAMFCELFGFEMLDRSPRDPAIISAVTGVNGAEVDIAYVGKGGKRFELLAYSAPADAADLRPRPHDLGSLHIALNVEDMDAALEKALSWPLEHVGQEVQIDSGPNKGGRIIYLRTPEEGLIIELIQLPKQG